MKTPLIRHLIVATVVVLGFASGLPAEAARAPRPPSTVTPPVPVSGL